MKEFLKKLIERKKAEMEELQKRSKASEDVAEVRKLGEQLQALRDEINDAENQLAELEKDNDNGADEERAKVPAGADLRNSQVLGSFGVTTTERSKDKFDTVEYREAFMEFVCRGTAIPVEYRDVTKTGDASVVIPTTLMNEIIQNLETYGNVYNAVRKLNVQGGIAIPVLSLKPEAKWIGETESSEAQKLQANEKITFSYFGVECKLAQTLLANVTTLDMFQKLFVTLATEAIVKALEVAIFKGNGTTQPLGVLNDTRVPEANVITLSDADMNWDGWHKKVKAKMKKSYRNGIFYMNQATFDGYIDGMVDNNKQPVGRTNYGINGEETYRFMGKSVETLEDTMLASYDDASEGDVIAVFMKPSDYAINTNMQMTTVKWTDHDTNEIKNKCMMICDGKLIDANGVLIIKKGAPTV